MPIRLQIVYSPGERERRRLLPPVRLGLGCEGSCAACSSVVESVQDCGGPGVEGAGPGLATAAVAAGGFGPTGSSGSGSQLAPVQRQRNPCPYRRCVAASRPVSCNGAPIRVYMRVHWALLPWPRVRLRPPAGAVRGLRSEGLGVHGRPPGQASLRAAP